MNAPSAGPWCVLVEQTADGHGRLVLIDRAGVPLAILLDADDPTQRANAELMARAPGYEAALADILSECEGREDTADRADGTVGPNAWMYVARLCRQALGEED